MADPRAALASCDRLRADGVLTESVRQVGLGMLIWPLLLQRPGRRKPVPGAGATGMGGHSQARKFGRGLPLSEPGLPTRSHA
jgi:hypothetical protein